LTLNKKHSKRLIDPLNYLIYLFIAQNFFVSSQLIAEESYKLNEIEINRTTNLEDEDNLDFTTNPFEIVDRIRRANILNDATTPSDAIDEAIKSFDMIIEDKQI
tara:strand:- start:324 stop:635 length:312 start_codon:yes stop_codon:yes gene_type:complete